MKDASELFTTVDGVKSDATLHEAILAEGDEVGAFTSTLNLLRENGFEEDEIATIYGALYQRWKERFA
jgi:hypothetical protein